MLLAVQQWPLLVSCSLLLDEDDLVLGLDSIESSTDGSKDFVRRLGSIDVRVEVALGVVVDQGLRLLMVGFQALLQGFGIVVRPLDQRLPRYLKKNNIQHASQTFEDSSSQIKLSSIYAPLKSE